MSAEFLSFDPEITADLNAIIDQSLDDQVHETVASWNRNWRSIKPNRPVVRNVFELKALTPQPKKNTFVYTSTNGNLHVRLNGRFNELSVQAQNIEEWKLLEHFNGGEFTVSHIYDEKINRERTIRTGFYSADIANKEYEALTTLAQAGYSVPQNPQIHQILFPWSDSISYDYIPGITLDCALEEAVGAHDNTRAFQIAELFGKHVRNRWLPLLLSPLPNGKVFTFPDRCLGNWIYTGHPNVDESFFRIDITGLSSESSPVGIKAYTDKILGEIEELQVDGNAQDELMDAFCTGFR